ncbi:MAG: fimbrillin family protein [Bacteroidales bacterium]|nr:fimbrillin family protein [Bacteroidales bacterium]
MKRTFILAIPLLLIAACDELETPAIEAPVPIRLGTSMQLLTRANSQSLQATELADQATVGVYIYQNTATTTTSSYGYKNLEYKAQNPTPAASGVTPGDLTIVNAGDQPYFPEDKTKTIDIYAFSPRTGVYTATAELGTLTAQDVFATAADQTAEADYQASDFIWGKAVAVDFATASSTTTRIPISLEHMLSKVNINIAPGTGMTLDKLDKAKITLNNVVLDGTVDFTTGAVTPRSGSTGATLTLSSAVDKNTTTTFGTSPVYTACTTSAVVIPQSIAASTTFLTIQLWDPTANSGAGGYGSSYSVTTTTATTFATKTVYTYNIIVNAQGLSLTTSITDWVADTSGPIPGVAI